MPLFLTYLSFNFAQNQVYEYVRYAWIMFVEFQSETQYSGHLIRYLAQKQELNVSVRISKLMLLQWSISNKENCLRVAITINYNIYELMSKLSENVENRLKAAQELLKKDKQKKMQSPNFIRIIVYFRKQSLISNIVGTEKLTKNVLLTEFIANNDVKVVEIKRMIRKRLSLEQNESIQLFCNKKILNDLSKTVKHLRGQSNEGFIQIEVTKMQVF